MSKHIYAVEFPDLGVTKIGISGDPHKRLAALKVEARRRFGSCGGVGDMWVTKKSDYRITDEKTLHKKLNSVLSTREGEWYDADFESAVRSVMGVLSPDYGVEFTYPVYDRVPSKYAGVKLRYEPKPISTKYRTLRQCSTQSDSQLFALRVRDDPVAGQITKVFPVGSLILVDPAAERSVGEYAVLIDTIIPDSSPQIVSIQGVEKTLGVDEWQYSLGEKSPRGHRLQYCGSQYNVNANRYAYVGLVVDAYMPQHQLYSKLPVPEEPGTLTLYSLGNRVRH